MQGRRMKGEKKKKKKKKKRRKALPDTKESGKGETTYIN